MENRKLKNQTMDKYLKRTHPNSKTASQQGASNQSLHGHPGSKKTRPNSKTASQQGASNQSLHGHPGSKKTRPNSKKASQQGASNQSLHVHPGSKKTRPNSKTASQQGASNQSLHGHPGSKKTRPNSKTASQQGASNQSLHGHPGSKKTHPNSKTASQQGASNQSSHGHPGSKEEAGHATHSIEYRFHYKKYSVTCNKVGTIEKSLQRSKIFREKRAKNKDKEIVILRDRRAISAHFPCSLIEKGQLLTIKYIKALKEPKHPVNATGHPQSRMLSEKAVTFHVATKGGRSITNKVMKNKALKSDEVSVFAYKGEKVRQALKRDGRFNNTIFRKGCGLSEPSTEVDTEMSNLVDDLDGKSFKIVSRAQSIHPDSQPSSLEEFEALPNESQGSPQQSTINEPLNTHMPEQQNHLAKAPLREIPDSGDILKLLRSQFNDLVKLMKNRETVSKPSMVQSLFTVEYGKSVQTCMEVKTVKKLMALGESVCQVRINGKANGSGFLLFDRFILTNGHVVKDIFDPGSGELQEMVTVTFCFEDLGEGQTMPVKNEVVAFVYRKEDSGSLHDMALLELCTAPDLTLPSGLLGTFGPPPTRGGICIIGHPGDGVKRMDPCLITTVDDRSKTVQKHYKENDDCMNLITAAFFDNSWDIDSVVNSDDQMITYESCFYHGSSGSPVFDEHCNLVAMHSGGYPYKNKKGQTQSVIEYAVPMSLVLEQILIQANQRNRTDVWQGFLKHKNPKCDRVMENVMRIINSECFNRSSEIKETNDKNGQTSFSESQEDMDVS